MKIFDHQK